jgi:RNA polymerase sigma-70 factor (ECF subfamily)
LDESDLIARVVLHDDHHAFAQLVRLHQSPLRLFLRRLTGGNEALADDLAQETFLRAYKKASSFRNQSKFRTWLFSIAVNLFKSEVRKKRWQSEELAAEPPQGQVGADQEEQVLRHQVYAAMEHLREEERVALACFSGMGLSHEETAAIMNCPVGTVKTHVLRGKKKLRERLGRDARA